MPTISINNKEKFISTIYILLLTVVFFAYAGLLYAGRWHGDEFHVLSDIKEYGFPILIDRILYWSPRPFSEMLLAAYFYIIKSSGHRLISEFLAFLWLLLFILPISGAIENKHIDKPLLLIISCLLILAIAGRNNSDVLYWTQGAVAYIPTFAFSLFMTARTIIAKKFIWTDWLILCLLALSSEAGAVVVLPFAFLLVCISGFQSRTLNVGALGALACTVVVIGLALKGRVSASNEAFNNLGIAGNLLLSLKATLSHLIREAFVFGDNVVTAPLKWVGLVAKGLLFVGIMLIMQTRSLRREEVITISAWAVSCLFAAFAVIFSSFYKFGAAGAPRHISTESLFIWLAIASSAVVVSQFQKLNKNARFTSTGLALVVIAAMIPVALTAKGMIHDYRNISRYVELRDEILKAGAVPGDAMIVSRCKTGIIVGDFCDYFAPGDYTRHDGKSWITEAIMRYFGKTHLKVLPPNG